MTHFELTSLMHAVLDGEATPVEIRELERLVAGDAAVCAEFDALRRLFDGLASVPQGYPPEGLVAAVMARLPERSTDADDSDQLLALAGVIGTASKEARGFDPGKSATVQRVSQTGPFFRGENMGQQKSGSFGKRKIWIGAGIAVAAAAVAVSTGLFPPEGKDATGTIVPALRYRADQPTAGDVKLGEQAARSDGPSAATAVGGGDPSRRSAKARDAQDRQRSAGMRPTSAAMRPTIGRRCGQSAKGRGHVRRMTASAQGCDARPTVTQPRRRRTRPTIG